MLLMAQTREAFLEAFPAHKFYMDVYEDINLITGSDCVLVKIVRLNDDHSWKGLVMRKSDLEILIGKAKEKLDVEE
jgi:hypothetical protein